MYPLRPALRHYDWGDTSVIPELLGVEADGSPWAEAWWGAHPAGPSSVEKDGMWRLLDEVIAEDPFGTLGEWVVAAHGATLPYLLKVLAIAHPLSIQVHPSTEVAEAGFDREEAVGLALFDAERVFKDRRHKPELLVALTPMILLSGFRSASLIAADLAAVGGPGALRLMDVLATGGNGALGVAAYVREALTDNELVTLVDAIRRGGSLPAASPSLAAAAAAAAHFPSDLGVLVALAMNVVVLSPGEALFTADGIVHSYQSGVGVEIMANSDNVIRAGLTAKHIDVPAVLEVARMAATSPRPPREERDGGVSVFSPPAREFRLTMVADASASFLPGPRIVLVADDSARLRVGTVDVTLRRGEAVFVPFSDGVVSVESTGRTVVAEVPRTGG